MTCLCVTVCFVNTHGWVFVCAPARVSLYCVFIFGTCACLQITSAHLYLCKGLYSNSSRATPVAVARTERIQKLSWQKLQYWMMARMVAQHKNMVTWRKGFSVQSDLKQHRTWLIYCKSRTEQTKCNLACQVQLSLFLYVFIFTKMPEKCICEHRAVWVK